MVNISSPIVVALDYHHLNDALNFVDKIDPKLCRLKVGKQMFTLFGPQIIYILHQRGFQVFLDLKFHDIPTTTAKAVRAAAELGVWMINVHAIGGIQMMHAARESLIKFGENAPLLIAVTVLTSFNQENLRQVGINNATIIDQVNLLSYLTWQCGLDGIICSPHEVKCLKKKFGYHFLVVTPGIRPNNTNLNDQKRTMTPQQAKKTGVDYMIIGRPITQSQNPNEILNNILYSLKANE